VYSGWADLYGPPAINLSRVGFVPYHVRTQKTAQLLEREEQTNSAARTYGVTSTSVSQTKAWLYQNRRSFNAQTGA
jgi:hypothetical protein